MTLSSQGAKVLMCGRVGGVSDVGLVVTPLLRSHVCSFPRRLGDRQGTVW